MANSKESESAFNHRQREVSSARGSITSQESKDGIESRRERLLYPSNYERFISYYFSEFAKSETSYFQKATFLELASNDKIIQFRLWYRGAAKSVHTCIFIPIWLLLTGRTKMFLIVGVNGANAMKLLSDVRSELEYNLRLRNDFGNGESLIESGSDTKDSFKTKCGSRFMSLGINQPVRGLRERSHRLEYVVIDDIETQKSTYNPQLIANYCKSIREGIFGAFGTDGKYKLVINNNLFTSKGIIASLLDSFKGIASVSRINLLDEAGNYSWAGGHPKGYADEQMRAMGSISFAREMMNEPIEDSILFSSEDLQYKAFGKHNKLIVGFWDLSYTRYGDHKAFVSLCMHSNGIIEVKDVFCRQCTLSEVFKYHFELTERYLKKGHRVRTFYDGSASQEVNFKEQWVGGYTKHGRLGSLPRAQKLTTNKHVRIESSLLSDWQGRLIFFNEELKGNRDLEDGLLQLYAFSGSKSSSIPDDFPDAFAACRDRLRTFSMAARDFFFIIPKAEIQILDN